MHTLEEIIDFTQYPSGEFHTKLDHQFHKDYPLEILAANVRNFNDLAQIVTLDQVLRRTGTKPRWFVPFFPFARDDRRNTRLDGFELGLALDLVKDLDITILDPHSDVAGQLPHIPQFKVVQAWMALWNERFEEREDTCFIVPDAGAIKKASDWTFEKPMVYCAKTRDSRTGKLSGFEITQGVDWITGRHCILVDDICDGGGTFLGLGELIRQNSPASLSLAVTHGLFTKGLVPLYDVFDHIYTTGSFENTGAITAISHNDIWQNGGVI